MYITKLKYLQENKRTSVEVYIAYILSLYLLNETYSESQRAGIEPTGGQSSNKWFDTPRKSQHTENTGPKTCLHRSIMNDISIPSYRRRRAGTRSFALIISYFSNN